METFDWTEFWNIFFGNMSFAYLAANFLFFLIGAAAHFSWKLRNREKTGRTVPKKFNLMFMIKDNILRWLGVILVIFINIRFFEEIWGSPLTPFLALGLGYSIDSIIGNGKKTTEQLTPFKKAKEKLLNKYNDE